jgi:hypothetical protein
MEGKIKSGKDLAERIDNRHLLLEREHGDTLERYEQTSRIGRYLIKRKHPRLVGHYNFIKAQQSIPEAKRSAQQIEGRIVYY